MSYSSNPLLPKARIWAINLVVRDGMTLLVAAQRAGIHRTTLWRWLKRYHELGYDYRNKYLATRSSRPLRPARQLSKHVIERIKYWRGKKNRHAGAVHAHCLREGTRVSLSSVKRVLKRLDLLRPVSKWKRHRPHVPRPLALAPGSLYKQTPYISLTPSLNKGCTSTPSLTCTLGGHMSNTTSILAKSSVLSFWPEDKPGLASGLLPCRQTMARSLGGG